MNMTICIDNEWFGNLLMEMKNSNLNGFIDYENDNLKFGRFEWTLGWSSFFGSGFLAFFPFRTHSMPSSSGFEASFLQLADLISVTPRGNCFVSSSLNSVLIWIQLEWVWEKSLKVSGSQSKLRCQIIACQLFVVSVYIIMYWAFSISYRINVFYTFIFCNESLTKIELSHFN